MTLDVGTPAGAEADSSSSLEAAREPAVCRCLNVSKSVVQAAIAEKSLRSVDEVTTCTQAGGACSGCHRTIRHMLADHHGDPTLALSPRRRGCL